MADKFKSIQKTRDRYCKTESIKLYKIIWRRRARRLLKAIIND